MVVRTSVMRYKRTLQDVREIGRELGADYLIEGGVRKERAKVRIAVQLIGARDGFHLWASAFAKERPKEGPPPLPTICASLPPE